ncbi:MAG TPA: DNA recombination protein RmuC [Patescibacteria group bacterium]|nr:DNA recombination protein RmuC [Patescibacteria group bacterium]
MDTLLLALVVILICIVGLLAYFLFDLRKKASESKDKETMNLMMQWMQEIKRETEESRKESNLNILETNKQINDRLTEAARVIGQLHREMGSMSQIGPDIRRLSEVLASPKSRGNFGEEILETMLGQVLPKSAFEVQYRFKNGETVDAMVRVGEKVLSIDSKFSLENFRLMKEARDDESASLLRRAFLKDVKKRVDEVYKKYILPQEGTFDFALMYVPSEGVFSEILEDTGVIGYGREKRVYFVSPNTLYHHLQIILLSLRGQRINKAAQSILSQINGIRQQSEKLGRNFEVLANHIKNAGNSVVTVGGDFEKLKGSITQAASLQLESSEIKELEN